MNEREREGTAAEKSGEGRVEEHLRAAFAAAYPRVKPPESLRQRIAAETARHEADAARQGAWWAAWWAVQRPAASVLAAALLLAALGLMLVHARHGRLPERTEISSAKNTPLLPRNAPGSAATRPSPEEQRGNQRITMPDVRTPDKSMPVQPGVSPDQQMATIGNSQPRPEVTQPGAGHAGHLGAGRGTRIIAVADPDLLRLNEGRRAAAAPYSPSMIPAPSPQPMPPVERRQPGSVVLDDLLNLNPIRVAAIGDAGFSAAAQTIAAAAPATDARLQQKVFVHATMQPLSGILSRLSKTTGVTLVPRMEVADEPVSLWADDVTLMDVMRDLRHLHGYYWSRSKRGGQPVYSLWQDAQSRAQEDAEVQRLALEAERRFQESIWQHVKALNAGDAELKRWARESPYFVVEMKHPVMRGGYQLFAALSPDQQALLTRGQTPSRPFGGEDLAVAPLHSLPEDPYHNSPDWTDQWAPGGDIVTLHWGEMTPAQRVAVAAIVRGAGARLAVEARRQREPYSGAPSTGGYLEWEGRVVAAANPETATATLFRWGDPTYQGLSLRVDLQSGGRPWVIYSNIGLPDLWRHFSDGMLRKGERLPGSSPEVDQILSELRRQGRLERPAPAPSAAETPDPVLDAPLSFTWALPRRGPRCTLFPPEIVAALYREIRRPLVLDGPAAWIEQPPSQKPEFRWEKRPVRELLHHFFPGWECQTDGSTIFLRNPNRLQGRLNAVPPAVERFLAGMKAPFTLDDMALLARALSPWQLVKLDQFLPNVAIDEALAAQELLRLYGELAPAQRAALPQGLPFAALTPPQQTLFLQFAQRQRPFAEPWRFQQGGLQMTVGPSPVKGDGRGGPAEDVKRALFRAAFGEGDAQAFPIDLFPPAMHLMGNVSVQDLVGKPFPFAGEDGRWPTEEWPLWKTALSNPRLQHHPLVILLAWPYAEPYADTQSPPASAAWARALAERLRGTGVLIAHVSVGAGKSGAVPGDPRLPHLLFLNEPGDENGQPIDSHATGCILPDSPTLFVVGSDGITRAAFEGQEAWDTAAVERAARAAP
jgi:hypothetical protein